MIVSEPVPATTDAQPKPNGQHRWTKEAAKAARAKQLQPAAKLIPATDQEQPEPAQKLKPTADIALLGKGFLPAIKLRLRAQIVRFVSELEQANATDAKTIVAVLGGVHEIERQASGRSLPPTVRAEAKGQTKPGLFTRRARAEAGQDGEGQD